MKEQWPSGEHKIRREENDAGTDIEHRTRKGIRKMEESDGYGTTAQQRWQNKASHTNTRHQPQTTGWTQDTHTHAAAAIHAAGLPAPGRTRANTRSSRKLETANDHGHTGQGHRRVQEHAQEGGRVSRGWCSGVLCSWLCCCAPGCRASWVFASACAHDRQDKTSAHA